MDDDQVTDPPGPPTETDDADPPITLPPPRATRPGGGRPASPLTLGSRPLALAIAVVLLGTTFIAGFLGYRDHRNDSTTSTVASTTPVSGATTSAPAQAAATSCKQPNGIPKAAGKPTDVEVPPKPVTTLQTRDLKPGSGKAAVDGDQLSLQYVGISCTTGKQIDSSWDRNETLPMTLGAGDVIPGWDQGIKGMKVGGQRLLWIPGSLAYGAQGKPPDIAPDDTLIFVIDLVKIG